MNQILCRRCDWLPQRHDGATKDPYLKRPLVDPSMILKDPVRIFTRVARSGLPAVFCSHIIILGQASSDKMAGCWPRSFFWRVYGSLCP